ncbi:MAG: hypothetical protein O3B43_07050 [Chloroflexi bacterium]|nr:hypothetical protein [Chloroflexota bacterium]
MKEIRAAVLRHLDLKARQPPAHLKGRVGSHSPLAEAIQNGLKSYSWHGLNSDSEGNVGFPHDHGKAANERRKETALVAARRLADEFGDDFWDAARTNEIAEVAGKSPRTIRNYRERLKSLAGKAK